MRRYKRRRGHNYNWLILLPLALLIVAVIWLTLPSSKPPQDMNEADVHLLVTMSGWNPDHFEAKAGVPVRVMLMTLAEESSHSDNIHSFILKETNTAVYVKAGESQIFTITFSKPGTYTFWCTTCCGGVLSPNMAGHITVT